MRIAIATTNQGKISEIKAILDLPNIDWWTMNDGGDWPVVEETAATFRDNARQKAVAIARHFDMPALADDSGLEVDVLGGLPGVRSARFAGPQATDADNVAKLTSELGHIPAGHPARFISEVVLVWPDGRSLEANGTCPGAVISAPRGSGGFGYDPVFVPDGFELTMAQLSPAEKNQLSHRGQALRRLKNLMAKEISAT